MKPAAVLRAGMLATLLLASVSGAMAQTSASYRLTEFTFNNGGDPQNGSFALSASYRIRLDAIGDAVAAIALSSASNHTSAGLVADNPPPGEVKNQRWTSKTTFIWDPEKSIGSYAAYRATLGSLPGNYGACLMSPIASESWTDSSVPAPGTGYFYLVTARNRLGEEGTKGFASSGIERPNPAPCP